MSCPLNKNTDFYIRAKSNTDDCPVSSTVIARKKCLAFSTEYKEQQKECTKLVNYPFANSYYPYTEDVDVLGRIQTLLENYKPSLSSLTSSNTFHDHKKEACFTRNDVVLNYLESNPVSFVILGKPGIGEEIIAKELADYWQCIYIDPETLVKEELESNSRAGQCIEFNLRCGRAVGVDIIFKLLERKIKSSAVRHRGFVLCGLPFIPNCNYEEDPVSSVSAIFNVKEIFEDVIDNVIEVGAPPSPRKVAFSSKDLTEDVEDEETEKEAEILPKTENKKEDNISIHTESALFFERLTKPDVGLDYEQQLNFIFSLLQDPFIIIYMTCPTSDVINKRNQYRFDVYSQRVIDLQREYLAKNVFKYIQSEPNCDEIIEELIDKKYFGDVSQNFVHLVHLPFNFPTNVSTQLDSYHCCALNHIETRILAHDPQYFVKIDGRTNPSRMFSIVKARLKLLPLQKVLNPVKLYTPNELLGGENDEPLEENDLTLEESYVKYFKQSTIRPYLKWILSDWGYLCPVSMVDNIYRNGDPKFAVRFLNRIFYLANEESLLKFYNNPRLYLMPPFPRAGNKVFVFGPKYSGKTAISKCLSYYLNSEVVNMNQLFEKLLEEKINDAIEENREVYIREALDRLNEIYKGEYEKEEKERNDLIDTWVLDATNAILALLNYYRSSVIYSSFALRMSGNIDENILLQLAELGLPPQVTEEQCIDLLDNKPKLLVYLPENLKEPLQLKIASISDVFVQNYVTDKIKSLNLDGIKLDNHEFRETLISNLKQNSPGWIVDNMYCNLELLQSLPSDCLPNEVVVLRDVNEFEFLLDNLKNKEIRTYFDDFRNFFLSINQADAAWRAPSKVSQTNIKTAIATNIIENIIETNFGGSISIEKYKTEILHFEENWKLVMSFFKENNIHPIEIIVTNKSIVDLLKEVVKIIDCKFKSKANELTEIDRAEEAQYMTDQNIQDEDAGEGDVAQDDEEDLEKIRRYGETYHFCPVTFSEKWVLWKGQEEYASKFENKVYLMSSDEVLKRFLEYPRDFIPNIPCKIPPPRICVIGLGNFENSDLCRILANNLGVHYINYEEKITNFYLLNKGFNEILKDNSLEENELYKHLKESHPLSNVAYETIINNLWFKQPFKVDGFLIKDFPKRPIDIETIIKHCTIPEMIIEITCDESVLRSQLLEKALTAWQTDMNAKLKQLEEEKNKKLNEWQVKRQEKYNELMEQKRDERYKTKFNEMNEQLPESDGVFQSISQISYDSVAEQADKDEIEKVLNEEMPPIVFEDQGLETESDAKERLSNDIEEWYNTEYQYLMEIKELCLKENIIWNTVNQSNERTLSEALYTIKDIQFNRKNILERCYEVSLDIAEELLSCGYYFLSPFGKTCPVQYFEQNNPIQMHSPAELSIKLYPVIHYEFIYFLVGREAVEKFFNDPLKYADVNNINFPLIPYKIAITGPPKCGKTSLARRFKEHFNFKIVSRGSAARFVLGYLPHTDLANNMELVLRQGWELTDEMVIKCVDAACYDSRVASLGVLFDGFPNSINEVRHLSYVCRVPNLVIDLQADEIKLFECLSNDKSERILLRYGEHFMRHLYKEWCEDSKTFRKWLDREYQIIGKIKVVDTKWSIWKNAYDLATSVCWEIMHYYRHIVEDWPLRLANMLVTPIEFLERQSSFKNYCPCCLFYNKKLNYGGSPPDRTGLVQYRAYFYWLCSEHIEAFLKVPDLYTLPYNPNKLPENLPQIVNLKDMPSNLFQDGHCVVCYKKSNEIVKGDLSLAVLYNDLIYLFDVYDCLNEYMNEPFSMADDIDLSRLSLPPLNYNELPVLGMLQQYVAKDIIKALSSVTRSRPIIPGLGVQQSAAIAIGLYLKCNNKRLDKKTRKNFEQALGRFNKRMDNLLKYLDRMKTCINPYVYYEEPLPKFAVSYSNESSGISINTVVSNIVNAIVDKATI